MKTRIFLVLAAIGLLASCAKEQAIQNENVFPQDAPAGVTTLTVGLSNPEALNPQQAGVKTHMDAVVMEGKHKVYWSNGDQIAVNGTASQALSEIPEYSQTATFNIEGVLSTPYNIVYPASICSQDAASVTLPAIQDYRAGGFAEGMYPMAGYSADGQGVTLNYLCTMLKISVLRAAVDADEDNLIAVRFKGRNDEQVCGSFAIDYETATLTGTSTAAADKEVKIIKEQETSTSTAVVYYIVVPAGTYSNGFDIIVQDVNGHIMTQSKTESTTLVAGHLYAMPQFEFIPTATELGVEIASAQDLIQFATDYNNEVYVPLGDALVATLTSDITFDAETSAAFDATKGIASVSSENYFHGIFDGAGHTISGLSATVPLFAAIGSSGIAKNFTMDNTCSFTFTHPNTTDANFGAAVGYHKGMLDNVTVAADVTLAAVSGVAYETCLGGLVGRETEGTIDNCTYSGALSIPSGFASADKKIQIGGLVGRISNAKGKVLNSDFEGTLENEGKMVASSEADDLKNNPYLMIGGIVGLNSGTVSNCSVSNHATGITVTLTDTSDHNYTGTLVTHSTNAYHYALAGIAGRNDGTVADCTNNAAIVNIFSAERGTGGNMNGRYLNVGGLVAFNTATVSGSDNYGSIIDRANPKVHYVGGLVGRNKGTVSSCANNSSAAIGVGTSHLSPYSARMLYLGGALGMNETGATVSDVQNTANLTISRVETTDVYFARIGGVVGQSAVAIDGSVNGGVISNSGNISQSNGVGHCATPTSENDYGIALGGVVGYSTVSISHVSNSGNVAYTCSATGAGARYVYLGGVVGKVKAASTVDVAYCSNAGKVTYTASAKYSDNTKTRYYYNYLGGVVGYALNANIKGDVSSKTTNSGQVKGGDGSGNYNPSEGYIPAFFVGGIVGYLTGTSSIAYCDLIGSGNPYNDHFSNRLYDGFDCPPVGGIAGQIVGTSEVPISVSHCAVASTASVNARRGAVGGIVGLSQYGTISDCTVPINLSTTQSAYYYGGIVGAAQNSTVSACTYSGTTIQSSQIKVGGGIIGVLSADAIIDSCSSAANSIKKGTAAITLAGGIAGQSVAGSTIKNSHYVSDMAICGDKNFTDGGGNVADL